MRKLSPTEIGGLILATLLVISGLAVVLAPREGLVWRQATSALAKSTDGYLEPVSKNRARFYGALAILSGCGIAALALYPRK